MKTPIAVAFELTKTLLLNNKEWVMRDPVIILGMHRSGTSTISRRLESLGLFQGTYLDGNHEPFLFRELNDWLLRSASATWDFPLPFQALLNDSVQFDRSVEYLANSLLSARAIRFLGLRRFLSHFSVFRLREPWGWKDPRNSLTLPLWLKLFPQAKIIHIIRHGVDVSSSLVVRQKANSELRWQRYVKRKAVHYFLGKRNGFSDTLHASTLENAFLLWCRYIDQITLNKQLVEPERYQLVYYEEFLMDPVAHLRELADFCELETDLSVLHTVATGTDSTRAFAYRNNGPLQNFADSVQSELAERGFRA